MILPEYVVRILQYGILINFVVMLCTMFKYSKFHLGKGQWVLKRKDLYEPRYKKHIRLLRVLYCSWILMLLMTGLYTGSTISFVGNCIVSVVMFLLMLKVTSFVRKEGIKNEK